MQLFLWKLSRGQSRFNISTALSLKEAYLTFIRKGEIQRTAEYQRKKAAGCCEQVLFMLSLVIIVAQGSIRNSCNHIYIKTVSDIILLLFSLPLLFKPCFKSTLEHNWIWQSDYCLQASKLEVLSLWRLKPSKSLVLDELPPSFSGSQDNYGMFSFRSASTSFLVH